jgi:hypothetical protein
VSVYLITYDLNAPGKDYKDLYEKIKSIGDWATFLESVWFVETTKSSNDLRDLLLPVIDKNDSLFITKVTSDYSGWANTDLWPWLSERI